MAKAKTKTKPKKRTKTRSPTKSRAAAPSRKKPSKQAAPKQAKAGPASKRATEVERTWRDYWKCRTDLEKAVKAVREAEKSLATARGLERTCREVFDRTKNALKSLLEVEPASGERSGAFDLTGKGLSVPGLDDDERSDG